MAHLVAGITGRAAGTCAGVQLYKARRGSGRVTAVRSQPEITAPRSTAQLMYQMRMSELRRLPTTITYVFQNPVRAINTHPFGWFADWFSVWAPQISPGSALTTLKTTGFSFSKYGAIPRTDVRLYRVSSTALTLSWSTAASLPGQLSTDRLYYCFLTCSQPWTRTSTYYKVGGGSTLRTAGTLALTGFASSLPVNACVYFARASLSPLEREPIQILTISS